MKGQLCCCTEVSLSGQWFGQEQTQLPKQPRPPVSGVWLWLVCSGWSRKPNTFVPQWCQRDQQSRGAGGAGAGVCEVEGWEGLFQTVQCDRPGWKLPGAPVNMMPLGVSSFSGDLITQISGQFLFLSKWKMERTRIFLKRTVASLLVLTITSSSYTHVLTDLY